MKIVRILVTILLAAILFPTIYLSLQFGILYQTVYNESFVEDIIDDSNITGRIIHSIIEITNEQVENNMMSSQVPIDIDALTIELTNALESGDMEDSINDFILDLHQYYFGDASKLPVLNLDYLDDIFNDLMISMVDQVVLDNGLADLSQVSTALEAGYSAGLINEDTIDSAVDYLRNSDVEIMNSDPELLIAFIEAYNEEHLNQSSDDVDLQETLNDVVLNEYLAVESFPDTLDTHQLVSKLYGDEHNPITALKGLTNEMPRNLFWILISLLLGLPIIYLVINRLKIINALQFFAITGLVASFISLAGSILAYWFAPSTGLRIMMDVESVPILDEFMNFLDQLVSRYMSEAIKINLLALIAFVVILIITEIIKRITSKDESSIETNTEIALQLGSSLIIALILILLIRYETQMIRAHVNDYRDVVSEYEHHEIDTEIFYDLDELFDQ